jgi:hypothetical protein
MQPAWVAQNSVLIEPLSGMSRILAASPCKVSLDLAKQTGGRFGWGGGQLLRLLGLRLASAVYVTGQYPNTTFSPDEPRLCCTAQERSTCKARLGDGCRWRPTCGIAESTEQQRVAALRYNGDLILSRKKERSMAYRRANKATEVPIYPCSVVRRR